MEKKKIVIIEPEIVLLESLTALFKNTNEFEIVGFEEVDKALKYIFNNEVDLIFTETWIPVPDSWDHLGLTHMMQTGRAFLKMLEENKIDLPIVFFTTHDEEGKSLSKLSGKYAHVAKPSHFEESYRLVKRLIK